MIAASNNYKNAINASVRKIGAKVEVYQSGTLAATYTNNDAIKSVDIERVGEDSKFFGFGVTHKGNIKLRDIEREINLSTDNYFKIYIGVKLPDETIEYISFTKLFITEVNRDEKTNELSITAYDALDKAKLFTVNDFTLETSYTIKNVINAIATKLGANASVPNLEVFEMNYPEGANFEGSETLQSVLMAAAEATQTIYYMNGSDELVFKRLDKDGEAIKTISKANYIDLDSKTNRRLATICSVTELGDNVSASITEAGTTQYLRDNPFLELREDIATLLENAIAAVGGMTINQFECNWRGDVAVEIGDKLSLIAKDGSEAISYLLNDKISYNGSLSQKTLWEYTDSETVESNPTTLGDILKQTYAKVDKANKEIELLTSETTAHNSAISVLQMDTQSINASVQNIEASTNSALESVNADIETITKTVETKMTAEEVNLAIKNELDNGVSKVETSTGFKFDENGLSISKTGSEMETNVDEDGLSVYRDNEEVLTADNEGVKAYNLHARTYLIIGTTSRFEDYEKNGEKRTGCFWIGGAE